MLVAREVLNDVVWVAVAVGSALGGVARYGLTEGVARLVGGGFPFGTLLVNVLGSAAIGASAAAIAHGYPVSWSATVRHGFVTGVLGGFTTFSALSMQTLALLQEGQIGPAVANVVLSVVLGLAACWAGFAGVSGLVR